MQAIPSPRPIAPMPSLVVALTLTRAERTPLEQRAPISALWGPSFGSSQITVASTLTTAPGERADHDAQQVDRVGVAPVLLVVGEELADVAEAAGAEQRVDHRVGEHVGVGVAGEAALVLDLDPADHQAVALDEAVAVVADSDPQPHQVLASPESRTSDRRRSPSGSRRRSRPSKTQISLDAERRRGTRAPRS